MFDGLQDCESRFWNLYITSRVFLVQRLQAKISTPIPAIAAIIPPLQPTPYLAYARFPYTPTKRKPTVEEILNEVILTETSESSMGVRGALISKLGVPLIS